MKSLTINDLLHQWSGFHSAVNQITDSYEQNAFPLTVSGIHGSLFAYFIGDFARHKHSKTVQAMQYSGTSKKTPKYNSFSTDILIVVPTEFEANNLAVDFNSVYPQAEVFVFPGWGLLPYRPAAVGSVVFGKRAGFLSKLVQKPSQITVKEKTRIFIIPQRSFLSALPPPEYIKKQSFKLEKGTKLDTAKIAEKLTSLGYTRVPKVTVRGEFSLRGEVLDIFLPAEENAVRVIFDFDEIESFKDFDADSQSTIASRDDVTIYPMKEVLWTQELVENLSGKLDEYQKTAIQRDEDEIIPAAPGSAAERGVHLPFTEAALKYKDKLLSELSTVHESEGEEFYYELLWEQKYTILDYFDDNAFVFFYDYDRMENAKLLIQREFTASYRKSRESLPVLPPEMILFDFENLLEQSQNRILLKTVAKDDSEAGEGDSQIIKIESEPGHSYFGNINYLKDELREMQKDSWHVYIFADNENQSLRLKEIFKDFVTAEDGTLLPHALEFYPLPISAGFIVPEIKLLVIQENEIFGRRKYVPKTVNKAKSKPIDTFVELQPGDYIVHVNWGIGLFHGIERVKAAGNERDYIKLEYADKEYAFVPIEQVNLVQRYIGNEGDHPRLDRIGSKAWENRKAKTRAAVEEIAQKLIDLYSRRQAAVGFAFPKETEWQTAFEAAFPYEDTPDQITVTEDIKADMEKPVPMDRLICGDVGYGKTEIAMRAAFKAVMGGKQVAFLAPTTILAEQHYDNCVERFKNFPVKIERMSRFVSTADQKKTLARLAEGNVDILVGTHRIIQKDVKFKNLGLMIIDEEQRFGVKDKEKLKEMKNNIDCLTMSATPIPRTLHMSLLKIRDMSLLTTPPQNRQPIETVIDEYTDARVAHAIRQEIERGGQIFYLHNRVETLLEVRHKIEQIVPEVLVDVAHGQMTSTELDDIFHRFKMGGFHVLIATTIIENGIDIPNVNTIIIDRADMYGVSQLYQLRGRVGRSDRQAYAYLLYPEHKALSEVAMKRLQVISDFTELGSGFKIAMKDMEIRGAGNLLGRDQSGEVYSVGFDMYVRLLNDAVNRLMAQKDYDAAEHSDVIMELEYTGFIPDTYIFNQQIKMEIYKKISSVTTDDEFDAVLGELNDRFGPIPEEVSSLLALAEIRILCKKLKIGSLKERMGEVKVEFKKVSDISIDKFMKLLQKNPGTIRLDPQLPNVIFIKLGKIGLKEKSEFIREKLSQLG